MNQLTQKRIKFLQLLHKAKRPEETVGETILRALEKLIGTLP